MPCHTSNRLTLKNQTIKLDHHRHTNSQYRSLTWEKKHCQNKITQLSHTKIEELTWSIKAAFLIIKTTHAIKITIILVRIHEVSSVNNQILYYQQSPQKHQKVKTPHWSIIVICWSYHQQWCEIQGIFSHWLKKITWNQIHRKNHQVKN